jgi:hypothetical protein
MKRRHFLRYIGAALTVPVLGRYVLGDVEVSGSKAGPIQSEPTCTYEIGLGYGRTTFVVQLYESPSLIETRVLLDGAKLEEVQQHSDESYRLYHGGSGKWFGAIRFRCHPGGALDVDWFAVADDRACIERTVNNYRAYRCRPVTYRGIPLEFSPMWSEPGTVLL